ncbi:MAG: phytoene/squalene synthase family protein [Pelagibacterales bacterium]|nr:phytoene/squalene synthase family protein [Pelagibacterales bacterium]
MKAIFDKVSEDCSKIVIKEYSTSFYRATILLSKSIRNDIFNIYGFVRFADEIVDTFHKYPKKQLLDQFEQELWLSIENKISLNPILNSFQYTVNKYGIEINLIKSFIKSMRMDLDIRRYTNRKDYKDYIYGSADVVGLMCLKVFVSGSTKEYNELKPHAMSLGSAFQKVNFLRDLKSDSEILNRVYFPNIDMKNFDESSKHRIIKEIEKDFEHALKGIVKLPKKAKFGVYIAYRYYNKLLKKLKNTPSIDIKDTRVRIDNFQKFTVLTRSYVKYQLNLILWI